MKRIIVMAAAVLLLGAAALLIFGNQPVKFEGDRSADGERFSLRFDALNGEDAHALPLKTGDRLRVSWQIEKGSMDLTVTAPDGTTVYRANGRQDAADFELQISQDGKYTVRVTGRHAKGWMECALRVNE